MIASQSLPTSEQLGRRKRKLRVGVQRDSQRGVLILGSGPLAATIVSHLKNDPNARYRFVGCLDGSGRGHANGFVIGTVNHFGEIVARGGIRCVVVALSERRGMFPAEELLKCRTSGIRVADGVAFYEEISGTIPLAGLTPSALIFGEGFKRHRFTTVCKRIIDVLVSSIGLFIAMPILTVLTIAIKVDSRGPVLFKQERVGEGGRMFRLLKFRTMRWEPHSNGESRWSQENDSRLTRVGRIIRRWRLDELPQLWNVLRGDTSFVGPRPDVPSLRDTLLAAVPYYELRSSVKPGLTGWAQVRYHYVSSVQEGIRRHEHDLFYIKNMSLRLDLRIIGETFKIVVLGKGAR
jgi:exopolysaccharide biosynthesis polyprenyl glycosylphosphotransferase